MKLLSFNMFPYIYFMDTTLDSCKMDRRGKLMEVNDTRTPLPPPLTTKKNRFLKNRSFIVILKL